MIFRKSGKISHTWFYNENPIEIVNIFCYLGIVFSYTGSFSETQSVLAQQGREALFCLKSQIKQFLNIDPVIVQWILTKACFALWTMFYD